MSGLDDLNKRLDELRTLQLQSHLESNAGSPASDQTGPELNLLNVQGSGQGHADSSTTVKPKDPPKPPQHGGSLFSLSGALGTLKGFGLGAVDLGSSVYHSLVNPNVGQVTRDIQQGRTPSTSNLGLFASLSNTTSEVGTGLSIIRREGVGNTISRLWDQEVTSFQNGSSTDKGVQVGKSLFLFGTLLYGTGLGGKAMSFGRDMVGLSRGAETLDALEGATMLGRTGELADATSGAGAASRVFARGSELGANTRFLSPLSRDLAAADRAAGSAQVVRGAQETDRLLAELRASSDALSAQTTMARQLASDAGTTADAATATRTTTALARESRNVDEAMALAQRAQGPEARTVALRQLRERVTEYNRLLDGMPDAGAARISDRALADFESLLTRAPQGLDLSQVSVGSLVAGEAPTALTTSEQAVSRQIQKVRDLTAGSSSQEALNLQARAGQLERDMRGVSAASDAAAREQALGRFERSLAEYNAAVADSSFAGTAGSDLRVTDQFANDFRRAARTLDFTPSGGASALAEARGASGAALDNLELRQQEITQQLQTARRLSAGTRDAAVIDARAQQLEGDMRGVSAAADAAARDRALARFDRSLAAYNDAVRGSSLADAGVTVGDRTVAEFRGAATAAADLAPVTDAARLDAAATAGRTATRLSEAAPGAGAAQTDSLVARADTISAGGRSATAGDTIIASRYAEPAATLEANTAGITARLDEARALGSATVTRTASGVEQNLIALQAVVADSAATPEALQAASGQLRNAIAAYNQAVDAAATSAGQAGALKISESEASVGRIFSVDRGVSTIYGDGSGLYVQRNLAAGGAGQPVEGSLAGTIDRVSLARATGGSAATLRDGQQRLQDIIDNAVNYAYRGGAMVRGLAGNPWITTPLKAYLYSDAAYVAYTGLGNMLGRLAEPAGQGVATADTQSRQGLPGQAPGQGTADGAGGGAEAVATTGGAASGAAGALQRPAGQAAGGQELARAGGTQDKASSQVFASPAGGPAFSPVMQAFGTPRADLQAIPGEMPVVYTAASVGLSRQLKRSQPSWWSWYTQGDGRVGPILLKGEETQPAQDPVRSLPIYTPPRRIGGAEADSQRVVTTLFDPQTIMLMQRQIAAGAGNRATDPRLALAGGVDRRGRGGPTINNDEDLTRRFPFLIPSGSGESGMRRSGLKLSKAEDQEHRMMGKILGGAAAQAATVPGGNDEEGSAPAVVAASQPSPGSSNPDEERNNPAQV